ncbi:MAG: AAA family ATPase [Pirellulaceae bacterium]
MYEQVFQLKKQPFSVSPNPEHYYPAKSTQLALAQCKLAVDRGNGPAVVIGNGGTGKTLLLNMLAEDYGEQFRIAQISCSKLDNRLDLLQSIMFCLKLPFRDMAEGELRLAFTEFLRPHEGCRHGVLILIDDAHWLNSGLLDELRMLSGISYQGQMRCHLILTGNRHLEETLLDPQNDSLNQRISCRSQLTNLTARETAEYVRAHLRRAGGGNRQFFNEQSLEKIHALSGGNPRLVNQLCDAALIACVLHRQEMVDDVILLKAWQDIEQFPGNWPQTTPSFTKPADTLNNESIEFGALEEDDSPTIVTIAKNDSYATSENPKYTDHRMPGSEETECCGSQSCSTGKAKDTYVAHCEIDIGYKFFDSEFTTPIKQPVANPNPKGEARSKPALDQDVNPFAEEFASEQAVVNRLKDHCKKLNQFSGNMARNEVESKIATLGSSDQNNSIGEYQSNSIYMEDEVALADGTLERESPLVVSTDIGQIWTAEPYGTHLNSTGAIESQGNLSTSSETIARMRIETVSVPFQHMTPMSEKSPQKDLGDDRDILIVNRPPVTTTNHQTAEEQQLETIEQELMEMKPMKGRAVRLDYTDLFKQLRQTETC